MARGWHSRIRIWSQNPLNRQDCRAYDPVSGNLLSSWSPLASFWKAKAIEQTEEELFSPGEKENPN
jgi:hypothetical protein